MAAFATYRDGNWSVDAGTASSPWYGGGQTGKPGDGDTVTLTHNVTVDENTTVGSNPDDLTTNVLVMGASKTLTVAAGMSLTVKGNISSNGTLQLNAGASFLVDKGTTTREYRFNLTGYMGLRFNGEVGSRCTFGGVAGSRLGGTGSYGGTALGFVCAYTDFVRVGSTSSYFIFLPRYTANGANSMNYCTFTECARLMFNTSSTSQPYSFTNCRVTGYTTDSSFCVSFGGGANSPATITNNVFDGLHKVDLSGATNVTFTDNYVQNSFQLNNVSTLAAIGNVFSISAADHVTAYQSLDNIYFFHTGQSNPHILALSTTVANLDVSNCILQHDSANSTDADPLIVGTGNASYLTTIKNNILMPLPSGKGAGTGMHQYTDSSDAQHSVYLHNTVAVSGDGESGICLGYSNHMNTKKLEQLKSNLFWTVPGQTGGWKAWRAAASAVQDLIDPAHIDYNWGWGLGAGNEGNGFEDDNGTNDMFTVATSTLDTHGGTLSGNPFVDYTRSVVLYDNASWGLGNANGTAWADATSYSVGDVVSAATTGFYGGATINYRCITAHTSEAGHATNGKPGAVATFRTNWEYQSCYRLRENTSRIAAMITAVKNGFKVYEADLENAGHDGATVGAMDYTEPDETPPGTPGAVTITAGDTELVLNWPDNEDADIGGYNIYRSTSADGTFTLVGDDVAVSTYTDTSLTNGTTYYYRVYAVDTSDNESLTYSAASGTPVGPAYATDCESVASGNWADAATWYGGNIPSGTETVTIAPGHNVTIAANVTTTGATLVLGQVTIPDKTLTLGADLTVGDATHVGKLVMENSSVLARSTYKLILTNAKISVLADTDHDSKITGSGDIEMNRVYTSSGAARRIIWL